MDFLSILLIAVGLSMDAFAVSISAGIVIPQISLKQILRASFLFGLFQFLMPVVGWLGGLTVEGAIRDYDHWIAFGLLAFIGARMVWGAIGGDNSDGRSVDITKGFTLLALAVATSIDALAVGLSLALLGTEILYPSLIIGVVAFSVSLAGFFAGRRVGRLLGRGAELLGGLVLIGIGIRILISHLFS